MSNGSIFLNVRIGCLQLHHNNLSGWNTACGIWHWFSFINQQPLWYFLQCFSVRTQFDTKVSIVCIWLQFLDYLVFIINMSALLLSLVKAISKFQTAGVTLGSAFLPDHFFPSTVIYFCIQHFKKTQLAYHYLAATLLDTYPEWHKDNQLTNTRGNSDTLRDVWSIFFFFFY